MWNWTNIYSLYFNNRKGHIIEEDIYFFPFLRMEGYCLSHTSRKQRLYEALNSEIYKYPEKLADFLAEVLDCPITIEDANHHLISYSKHNENIDEARLSTIIQRKVPNKVIDGLWKKGIMKKLLESDKPVIIPAIPSVGLGNRVTVSIRENDEILGFIWAHIEEKTIRNDDLELFIEASKFAKKYFLYVRNKTGKSKKQYRDFFWQLLLGDFKEENKIHELAKQFDMNLSGKLSIVIIDFEKVESVTDLVKKHAFYLVETLSKVNIVGRFFDQHQLILLVQLKKENDSKSAIHEYIQTFIDRLCNRLQIDHVIGSSGLIYDTPSSLHYSYKQANKVLELKRKFPNELENVYLYQDLGIYQFLDDLYRIRMKENYRNEVIEKLKEYDEENNTDLLNSLRVYLKNDSNVNLAAKKIHVHSNTMNYRLKRIAEICEIDLNDSSLKTNLYLDLLIHKVYH